MDELYFNAGRKLSPAVRLALLIIGAASALGAFILYRPNTYLQAFLAQYPDRPVQEVAIMAVGLVAFFALSNAVLRRQDAWTVNDNGIMRESKSILGTHKRFWPFEQIMAVTVFNIHNNESPMTYGVSIRLKRGGSLTLEPFHSLERAWAFKYRLDAFTGQAD